MFIAALFKIARTWTQPVPINRGMDTEEVGNFLGGSMIETSSNVECSRESSLLRRLERGGEIGL